MTETLLLIAGMAIVTYLPRVLPLLLLSSRTLPDIVVRWLELVPPAVLSALLIPALILEKDNGVPYLSLSLDNTFLVAALPAVLATWLTKNFFVTIAVGMGCVALIRLLGS